MTNDTAPGSTAPAHDLATLARDIRHAWLVTTAAIPLPAAPDMDDPETVSAMQARTEALSWALDETISGGFSAPQYQVAALSNGVLPVPENELGKDR
jgi:hypothetical protein